MKFRFMGPCLTRINIRPEQIVSPQNNYLNFWDRVAETFENGKTASLADINFLTNTIELPHSSDALGLHKTLYESVLTDTAKMPAHAVKLSFEVSDKFWKQICNKIISEGSGAYPEGVTKEHVSQLSQALSLINSSSAVKLYYSNIMILQFDVKLSDDYLAGFADTENSDINLNVIEWFGIALFQHISDKVEELLSSQISSLSSKHNDIIDISKERPQGGPPYIKTIDQNNKSASKSDRRGPALWVTRSLFLEKTHSLNDDLSKKLMACWLGPVSQDNWEQDMQETGYSMRWLRYGFDEKLMKQLGSDFSDAWESMLFSQFFWAAMETVEHEMFAVLGSLNTKVSGGKIVKASYQQLISVRETAELTLAHYEHLKRYLTRTRVHLVEQIMDGWGFQALVRNLRETITLCNRRHQMLLQRASAQNSLFTDILLFFIGTVAIIELMITMSITGRTLASDATLGLRNEGELDVMSLLSTLPMDRLLLSSVVIIGIILYFYVRYRSRQVL